MNKVIHIHTGKPPVLLKASTASLDLNPGSVGIVYIWWHFSHQCLLWKQSSLLWKWDRVYAKI